MGDWFNKPIDNLPSSISNLILGIKFNQPIDNLPNLLIHLKLCNYFNKSVDNLPKYLKYIRFGGYFNKSIDLLPDSIEEIVFDNYYQYNDIYTDFCDFGTSLIINQQINKLPKNLKKITIDNNRIIEKNEKNNMVDEFNKLVNEIYYQQYKKCKYCNEI